MSPWLPEPSPRVREQAVTLPTPGHADLAGVLKYGHDDVRNTLERASARLHRGPRGRRRRREGPARPSWGSPSRRPVEVGGETTGKGMKDATDAARKDRDTLGGIVEVVATGVPPGLGSYAERLIASTRGSRSP